MEKENLNKQKIGNIFRNDQVNECIVPMHTIKENVQNNQKPYKLPSLQ